MDEIVQTINGTITDVSNLDKKIGDNSKLLSSTMNNLSATTAKVTDNEKIMTAHNNDKNNCHNVTKTQVGLGNCDNTSDLDKPISTAVQNALDTKSPKAGSVDLSKVAKKITFGNGDNFLIDQYAGDYRQRIEGLDNATAGDAVFRFSQSEDKGVTYKNLFEIRDDASLYADGNRVYTTGNKPTKADVGLGNVPNVATNNQKPTFAQSTTLENIISGTNLSELFGKIAKAIADLITHLADNVKHITATERTNWNDANTKKHTHSNKSVIDKLTQAMLDKLAGIASGAEVNVQADWNITDTASDAFIKNKPTSMPANGGNAATADKLKTARNINNVPFDGSANITVVANPLITQLTNQNLNDVKAYGEYYGSGGNAVTGKPENVGEFGLKVYRIASGYIGQELFYRQNRYSRFFDNSVWSNWEKYYSTVNKPAWADVTGKPSTFTPSTHTHTKSQITDFPTSMPASDVSAWAKAATKPSYSWDEIGSKPTVFPPKDHNHVNAGNCFVSHGTDGDKAGKYFKIATIKVTGRYGFANYSWDCAIIGHGNKTTSFIDFGIWVKQQNDFGSNPYLQIYLRRDNTAERTWIDFFLQVEELNSAYTLVSLYGRINDTYTMIRLFNKTWNLTNATLTYDSPTFMDTLPTSVYQIQSADNTSAHTHTKSQITDFPASLPANGGAADTLKTARTINGTSFNGSANITTSKWGTARNVTIGNATKSVDGSANVSFSLAEIGVGGSSKSLTGTATAAGWTGTAAPYSQVITMSGVSANANIEVGLTASATLAQIEMASKCIIRCTAQGTNQITVKALKKKPTVDLPIQVLIIG